MPINRRSFLAASAVSASSLPIVAVANQTNPTGKIKVGQIGVGHAHSTKLSVYRESDDYEVVGIVEPNAKLRNAAESKSAFRDLPWMTQEQLLNVPGLQVVLVETEVSDLLNVAEVCIKAGRHIHLDKPAGESRTQFKRILNLAEKQKLMVQMGYMYRYNPAIVMLRDFLNKGWLGDVFEVHTVMSKVVPPASRSGLAKYDGGIMFELGCHIMDLVIGILGKPASTSAFNNHASPIKDSLTDNMLAVLSYPRATATIKSTAQEVDGFARRHLVVCGTEGTFHIQPLDRPSAKIALSKDRGKYKRGYQDVSFPKYTRYVGDAADMAKVIRGEKESDFSYQHDLTVQNTLLDACGVRPRP